MKNLIPLILITVPAIILLSCGGSGDDTTLYDVSVTVSPEGSGMISPSPDSSYEEGEDIQLQAQANDEYLFTDWGGSLESSENPLSITIDKTYGLTAHFERKDYELAVTTEGEGTVVEQIVESKAREYEHGTVVELIAIPLPDAGYRFVEWGGDLSGPDNPAQITVDEAKEVTAVFEKKSYELTVLTEGEGAISEEVVESKGKEYEHGAVVELTASAAEGWEFAGWEGDLSDSDNPAEITVDDPKEVTAIFEKKDYELAVTTEGSGGVSEQVVSKAKDYEYGDVIELEPNAAEGWEFVEWDGDLTGSDNPAQITVDTAKAVTAVFERKSFALDPDIQGEGSIAKDPDQSEYKYGDTVTLTGEPDENWSFKEWAGEISGTTSEIDITVHSQRDITAVFEEKPLFYLAENGVTIRCPEAEADQKGYLNGNPSDGQYVAADRAMLIQMIENGEDVTAVCTTLITDMNNLFGGDLSTTISFNQDISGWDVSNVTDMSEMFWEVSDFNQSIDHWDVSSVTDMNHMFDNASSFNGDIGEWEVSSVTDMSRMFVSAESFNQDIGGWDVSNVTDMSFMLYDANSFNQDIGGWDVSNVTNMESMFVSADSFNQDIGGWDVNSVTDMRSMFNSTESFNQDLGGWDVSSETDMTAMFAFTDAFNGDISGWDVSGVTNMVQMFHTASSFDQDLSGWCVSEIDSEPSDFSADAGFEGDNGKMPVWGTCP